MVEKVMVKFVKPYSRRFVGVDLEEYGEFEEGDILRMPVANADLLEDLDFVEKL